MKYRTLKLNRTFLLCPLRLTTWSKCTSYSVNHIIFNQNYHDNVHLGINAVKSKRYLVKNITQIRQSSNKRMEEFDTVPHAGYIEKITKSYIAVTLTELEDSLSKRYLRGYTRFQSRLALTLLMIIGLSIVTIYMFREPIKENISDEVADVASRSMGDESVVLKANEISRIVLYDIINDPKTEVIISNFFMQILKSQVVQEAAVELTMYVINDKQTQEQLNELVVQSLCYLLENKDTRQLLMEYLNSILLDPETTQACQELLKHLADQAYTQELLANFLKQVFASNTVTDQAVRLGKNVAQATINDELIQKETGNALWNVGWHSITPKWFSR